MNVILLSGGSGKRLWPLSNEVRSKQFIKLFKTKNGEYESMAQRIYRQIKAVDKNASVTIATSKTQTSIIKNQLGDEVMLCVEPERRDTFPAIVLASAFLRDVKKVSLDEPVVVCPVDPYVEDDYFSAIKNLLEAVETKDANLLLLGIKPTYPSEKYGYIIPEDKADLSRVITFKEKPDEKTAREYIDKGALWNAGVFAYKLGYVLDKAKEIFGFSEYEKLLSKYASLEKISFDYAVAEKESDICVMKYDGEWADLGTWNTLTKAMTENVNGEALIDEKSENVFVMNESGLPIICMGIKNAIIAASPDGILISDLERSSKMKPYVDSITRPVMYAEKSWGSYKVIDIQKESITMRVTLNPGHSMNYHSHEKRDEVWTIVGGTGRIIIDGMESLVKAGDTVSIKRGVKHTIIAETELNVIEVQTGTDIDVKDKIKHSL